MRLVHLLPFLLQSLAGPLYARADNSLSLVLMYIWVPSDMEAIVMNSPEWTLYYAVADYYTTENKKYHPDQDFRMIGRVELDTTSPEDFLIFIDPWVENHTRVKCNATRTGDASVEEISHLYVTKDVTRAVLGLTHDAKIQTYCTNTVGTLAQHMLDWGKENYHNVAGSPTYDT